MPIDCLMDVKIKFDSTDNIIISIKQKINQYKRFPLKCKKRGAVYLARIQSYFPTNLLYNRA